MEQAMIIHDLSQSGTAIRDVILIQTYTLCIHILFGVVDTSCRSGGCLGNPVGL